MAFHPHHYSSVVTGSVTKSQLISELITDTIRHACLHHVPWRTCLCLFPWLEKWLLCSLNPRRHGNSNPCFFFSNYKYDLIISYYLPISVGRASHQYRRGHGFKSSLRFFLGFNCLICFTTANITFTSILYPQFEYMIYILCMSYLSCVGVNVMHI